MISTATNQATQALEYAGKIAYSSKEVLEFSYKMAQKYADNEGVYVECGVAAGAQVIAMAAGAPNKTIYAFDSFQGIPLPSNKDNQMPGIKMLSDWEQRALPDPGKQALVSSGATSVPLKDVVQHIKNSGVSIQKIYFIEGWFEETLVDFECPPISILRLDGDLYNSTYVCLKYLYPKVIEGGLIIIDDWALPGCKSAVYQYFYDLPEFQSLNDQALANIGIEIPIRYIKDENSTVAYWTK